MPKNKQKLPTLEQAYQFVLEQMETPLSRFIFNCEPSDEIESERFRELLSNAIQYAMASLEPFGLTLDGADSRIRGTVHFGTPDLCKDCGKSTYLIVTTGAEGYMVCPVCGGCPDDDVRY